MTDMLLVLTRAVPPTIGHCELTHCDRVAIDVTVAARQHAAYENALRAAGATRSTHAPAPDLPDSVFIEDAAVVCDEVAVLMRPGAPSRRAEVDAVGRALAAYRPLRAIEAPGTMDGGDVLQIGRQVFVGVSRRTNTLAVEQLTAILEPFGYRIETVAVERCLHLKSAATALSDRLLVLNADLIDGRRFGGIDWIEADAGEPQGANVVRAGAAILCPESAPGTRARIEARGFTVQSVSASELAKAEAGLTCCSLIFRT